MCIRDRCPVRAVRAYLRRTEPLRSKDQGRLFISTGQTKKEVSKNTIPYWLREMITKAYESSEGEPLAPRIRAHEVREIAPTLLFRRNFAVDQVSRYLEKPEYLYLLLPQGCGT